MLKCIRSAIEPAVSGSIICGFLDDFIICNARVGLYFSRYFKFIIDIDSTFRLFGFNGGRLRMDERIDLSMSDPDLVPLIIQVGDTDGANLFLFIFL